MQKRKPASKKKIDPTKADNFISGADYAPEGKQEQRGEGMALPWEAPNVREDVTKVFNLRIPEPLFLKLKFLAEHTPKTSMHKICLDSVEEVTEHELKALTQKLSER